MEVLAWAGPTIIGLELASAVGLNVTLPVLVVAVLARAGNVVLGPGFALLGQEWAIAVLSVLASAEITASKYVSESGGWYPYLGGHDSEKGGTDKWMSRPRVPRLLTLPLAAATAVMLAAAAATAPASHGPTGLGLFMVLTASAVVAFGAQLVRMLLRPAVQAMDLQVPVSAGEDVASLAISVCALLVPVPLLVTAGVLVGLFSRRLRRLIQFVQLLSKLNRWR